MSCSSALEKKEGSLSEEPDREFTCINQALDFLSLTVCARGRPLDELAGVHCKEADLDLLHFQEARRSHQGFLKLLPQTGWSPIRIRTTRLLLEYNVDSYMNKRLHENSFKIL